MKIKWTPQLNHKRGVHMKNSYQKGNWKQYNQKLINRGSITFWFSKDVTKKWKAKKDKAHFGRPFFYSDLVILTAHTIRFVYQDLCKVLLVHLYHFYTFLFRRPVILKFAEEQKNLLFQLQNQTKELLILSSMLLD